MMAIKRANLMQPAGCLFPGGRQTRQTWKERNLVRHVKVPWDMTCV